MLAPKTLKAAKKLSRAEIVDAACSWIGTPYHHQASVKGVGCDCVGLVRGVWRDLIGPEPEAAPSYSRDWGDANGQETMLEFFRKYLTPTGQHSDGFQIDPLSPGDVVCMRWKPHLVLKHCLILAPNNRAIHAVNGAPVVEIEFSDWWRSKCGAQFSFPGVA